MVSEKRTENIHYFWSSPWNSNMQTSWGTTELKDIHLKSQILLIPKPFFIMVGTLSWLGIPKSIFVL